MKCFMTAPAFVNRTTVIAVTYMCCDDGYIDMLY